MVPDRSESIGCNTSEYKTSHWFNRNIHSNDELENLNPLLNDMEKMTLPLGIGNFDTQRSGRYVGNDGGRIYDDDADDHYICYLPEAICKRE